MNYNSFKETIRKSCLINNLKVLAIIPARGGSKGLHMKNIRPLLDKPLIEWTILAANESQYIDKTILSSDDSEIIKTVENLDCEIPFVRPNDLATDNAKAHEVIAHSLNCFKDYDIFVYLQPTSPLRVVQDIDTSIFEMVHGDFRSAVSICKTGENPFCVFVKNNETMTPLFENYFGMNRQELPMTFRLNGAIYSGHRNVVLSEKQVTDHSNCFYYQMPIERSIDIDNLEDFLKAEKYLASHLS